MGPTLSSKDNNLRVKQKQKLTSTKIKVKPILHAQKAPTYILTKPKSTHNHPFMHIFLICLLYLKMKTKGF